MKMKEEELQSKILQKSEQQLKSQEWKVKKFKTVEDKVAGRPAASIDQKR